MPRPSLPADPYPWPYDEALRGDRLALVVTGAQPWFVERTHAPVSPAPGRPAPAIDAVADVVRQVGGLVVFVVHHWPTTTITARPAFAPAPGDPAGSLAHAPRPDDLIVSCCGLDGFHGSSLELRLRLAHRDLLIVCGHGLETTVGNTVRSANDRGFECLTLTDLSSVHDHELAARALHSTTMSGGIFGAIASTATLLDALSAR